MRPRENTGGFAWRTHAYGSTGAAEMLRALGWTLVVGAGATALAMLALVRGETVNAVWFVVAAASVYVVGYRFYSGFLAARIFALDADHPTPAVRLNDGRD